MSYEYDYAFFIGRFQPFHNGHLHVAVEALKKARSLVFLVGSANLPRSVFNPFTIEERSQLIQDVMQDAGLLERIEIVSLDDHPYNDQKWLEQVQTVAREVTTYSDNAKPRIMLTGHDKDRSTWYLKKFPQWEFVPPETSYGDVNATAIRERFLSDAPYRVVAQEIPKLTLNFLAEFTSDPDYETLSRRLAKDKAYRAQYGSGPFQCVDNVVVQSGHVLLIERGKNIGEGELAIPGGHLEIDERLDHGAVRELFEETRIFEDERDMEKRRQLVWQGFRVSERFADPKRSSRARVITEAFLFKLPDGPLPKVQGADDAKRAFWAPLADLTPMNMFDDHYWIIQALLMRLQKGS